MIIPTLVDPSMAPPGKHVISCFVQYAPYQLDPSLGTWDDNREAFGDAVIDRIAEFAPNIRDIILHRQVLTPLDIERTIGLTEGNIFQGELSLEQLFFNRPVPGYARFRTPIRDLWLCGSSTHPGGGIMGANGRIAALEVLKALAAEGGLTMTTPTDAAERSLTTRSSSAPGTTASSPRPTWRGPACGVLVLERRERVGGVADTTELAPGVRVPALAHTVGRLRPSVVRELELAGTGCRSSRPDVRVFAPQPDGRAIALHADLGADGRRAARLVGPRRRRAMPGSTGWSGRSAGSSPSSTPRRRPT